MKGRYISIIIALVIINVALAWQVLAGNPDAPAAPESTSGFTIEDVYNAVNSDNANNAKPQTAFTEPPSGPGTGTMHTLDEIMAVLIGSVPKTGQTTCYDAVGNVMSCVGTGQDGEKRMGSLPTQSPGSAYTISEWTGTRFTDNGDGTVTDNVTGLIWLKDANCWEIITWTTALTNANALADPSCGLLDGSSAGDWRLPNVNELHSLIDFTQSNPALPSGHPFTDVQAVGLGAIYWSSSTFAGDLTQAWGVYMTSGSVGGALKGRDRYVWPVKGGQ